MFVSLFVCSLNAMAAKTARRKYLKFDTGVYFDATKVMGYLKLTSDIAIKSFWLKTDAYRLRLCQQQRPLPNTNETSALWVHHLANIKKISQLQKLWCIRWKTIYRWWMASKAAAQNVARGCGLSPESRNMPINELLTTVVTLYMRLLTINEIIDIKWLVYLML